MRLKYHSTALQCGSLMFPPLFSHCINLFLPLIVSCIIFCCHTSFSYLDLGVSCFLLCFPLVSLFFYPSLYLVYSSAAMFLSLIWTWESLISSCFHIASLFFYPFLFLVYSFVATVCSFFLLLCSFFLFEPGSPLFPPLFTYCIYLFLPLIVSCILLCFNVSFSYLNPGIWDFPSLFSCCVSLFFYPL